ncbi:MAG: DNA mismatch repair endonuclease MutL [Candidatus Gracilibacteria bacterium]
MASICEARDMGSIRVLPDTLINQIAAGEVIERPASVVKELVENSIDAKATHITVEIVKGGIEKIIITDDGIGMDESDARLSFDRHATSKIASFEDLFKIQTLGFRGEALASIASVSSITLQTKTAQALGGIRLEMEGGKNATVTATGCSNGTKLEVANLFFNTPARKKYLKSDPTEYRHVLETLQASALAHPEITFRFVSNGRTIFDLLKTTDLKARIGGLFGRAVSEEMIPIFYGGRDIQLSGFIGKPHVARTTRGYQYFIINGRPVQDTRLGYAIKEGYSNLIPASQYPVFVVGVTIAPAKIDVNVHPRKLEVRFADPHEIFRVLKSSTESSLGKTSIIHNAPLRTDDLDMPAFLRKSSIKAVEPQKLKFEEAGETYNPSIAATMPWSEPAGSHFAPTPRMFGGAAPISGGLSSADTETLSARREYLLKRRAERLAAQGIDPNTTMNSTPATSFSSPTVASSIPLTVTATPSSSSFETPLVEFSQSFNEARPQGRIRPIAQLKNSYILAEDEEGLLIVDQHAAHERVMLEKFKAREADRSMAKQPLLTPLHLDLDYREKALMEENLELLTSLGFEIHSFGGNSYAVDAVPDFLAQDPIEDIIKGFLNDLMNNEPPKESTRRHDHALHTLSCRAAAKFGQKLSHYEQEALIQSLMATENGSACAHGRPTLFRITFTELERKFGR